MANPFDLVIQSLGLSDQTTIEDSVVIYLLLRLGSATYTGSDVYPDSPRLEVLRRVFNAVGRATKGFQLLEKALGIQYAREGASVPTPNV